MVASLEIKKNDLAHYKIKKGSWVGLVAIKHYEFTKNYPTMYLQ